MLAAITAIHVLLSLIGIAAGLIVFYRFLNPPASPAITTCFLWTTVLTSVTGFFFPYTGITPGIILGVLSLIALVVALRSHTSGARRAFAAASLVALYFNCFVLVVQSFMKVPPLHALAPTQAEPPFAIAQLILLAAFLYYGTKAVRRAH